MGTSTPKLQLFKPDPVADLVDPAADFNANWDKLEAAVGSMAVDGWTAYVPVITNVGSSGPFGRWKRIAGKTVAVRFWFGLTAAPTGQILISMPTTAAMQMASNPTSSLLAPIGQAVGLRQTVGYQTGVIFQNTATQVGIESNGNGGSGWQAGQPVAWGNTDAIGGSFIYEEA